MDNKIKFPIIPFDLIVDIDYGLINLIKDEYRDDSVFNLGVVDAMESDIVYELLHRKNENPLSICIKSSESKYQNDLYDDFIKKRYNDIIYKSSFTNVYNAIRLFIESGGIVPCILCKNDIEKDFIKSVKELDKCRIIISENGYKKFDLNSYDPIYFKSYKDSFKCKDLDGKNIYLANYAFNYDLDKKGMIVPKKDMSVLFLDHNGIAFFDIYNIPHDYKIYG